MKTKPFLCVVIAISFTIQAIGALAQVTGDAPGVRPDAIVDLKTDEGMALVRGQWRYHDVKVIEVDHHGPGADLAPSGPPKDRHRKGRSDVRSDRDAGYAVRAPRRYDGKRLNSPNDLVYRSDGALYFADPPFGLPKVFDDPRKELPFSGVYCVKDGMVKLVSTDLDAPNGIALSPDEKTLYVSNWNDRRKVILRYDVNQDCTLSPATLFFDMTQAPGTDALDGLKVDQRGNVYSTGPGGLWIISPEGRQLGLIKGPEDPHNMAWGDDDGKTLYVTALTGIYRIRMSVAGVRP